MTRMNGWVVPGLLLILVIGCSWPTITQAADDDLRAELNQAQQEIQQLRRELTELKENSAWRYQQELQSAMARIPAASKDHGRGAVILPVGWSIQPYGYFKFDMSYDDSAINSGDFIRWANSETTADRADDQWNFTARQTRLGAKIFAPDVGDLKVMGRVEIDFYNLSGNQENKASPLLRHAYGHITAADNWSIIFGQTSDIISPLFMNTINYTVGWWGGNIGYRHPQLRFTKWWECNEQHVFKVETALSRDIGLDSAADFGAVDQGQDSSSPTVLGRLSYAMPLGGKKLEAGVSGHWGKEEYDWSYLGDDDEENTWSVNADLVLPLAETLDFKGEFFFGENLDTYLGGVGQGVNTVTGHEIESVGGWVQLAYRPCPEWGFNTGTGMDNPRDEDLDGMNARRNNYFAFGNVMYYFSEYLLTGLEVTYWRTDYNNIEAGDDVRIQHTWMLKF